MYGISSRRIGLSLAAVAIATAAATGVTSVTHAAPTTPGPVTYRATLVGHSVKLDVTNGTLAVSGGSVVLRNRVGTPVFQVPLSYNLEDRKYPIAARATTRSVTLTPIRNVARSTKADPAQVRAGATYVARQIIGYQTKQERDDAALARFQAQVSSAMTISTIIGLAIGLVVGVILVGGAGCLTIIACIPGILAGASLGSIIGVIAGGGGSMIAYGQQYFNTINSPFVPRYVNVN